ncbi:hypothetical protein DSLASN_04250 [Desulfoluna limicola]|uniref:Uncharacterized protein n=1 Tax=Desulfoluna limicola TaxID=2810562 RepID=A0ABN6EWQ4_9BACT|nr:hypothetical protein DSLASN_04250 [Desulfoluna limicola]
MEEDNDAGNYTGEKEPIEGWERSHTQRRQQIQVKTWFRMSATHTALMNS